MFSRVKESANAAVSSISAMPKAAVSRVGSFQKQAASVISTTASEAALLLSKNVKILDDDELFASNLGIEFEVKGTGSVFVTRLVEGSSASLSSELAVGDEVISIDGAPVTDLDRGETDGIPWIQSQIAGDVGTPLWLEIAGFDGFPAKQVCLIRKQPLSNAELGGQIGDLGIDFDEDVSSTAGVRVSSLIPGGAAWLAAQSQTGDSQLLARGDRITKVNGVQILSRQHATTLLESSSAKLFTRVNLEISRGDETFLLSLISRPRLIGDDIERALEYKAEVARWPAVPPSLRRAHRKLQQLERLVSEAPPVRGIVDCHADDADARAVSIHDAVAHAMMVQGPLVLAPLSPHAHDDDPDAGAIGKVACAARGGFWSEERRWGAAALCCCILGRLHSARRGAAAETDFGTLDDTNDSDWPAEMEDGGGPAATGNAAAAGGGEEGGKQREWEDEFAERLQEVFHIPAARRPALRHLVRNSAVGPDYYAGLLLAPPPAPPHGGPAADDDSGDGASVATCGGGGEMCAVEERRQSPAAAVDKRTAAAGLPWAVCFAALACAVGPMPSSRAGGGGGGGVRRYDARARAMLRRAAAELCVPWSWVTAAEAAFSDELARLAAASLPPPADAGEAGGGKGRGSGRFKRYAAIGTAAVAGGAVIGLTGGMAVPAVLAGLSVAGSVVGVGGSLAAGAAAFGGLGTVVGLSFGAAGAGLVGYKVAQRTGDVSEFSFDLVDSGPGLGVTVGVPGWLVSGSDSAVKAWELALGDVSADGGECLALRWESEALRRLGNALTSFMLKQLQGHLTDVIGTLVIGAAYASLAWPLVAIAAADVLDGPWAVAQQRADRAGVMLAEALLARAHGHRPAALVGYGMGARVVLQCLLELRRRGAAGEGIVESAVCLGTPFSADPETWRAASQVCSHRLVNGYCRRDWVLALVYRSSSLTRAVAGLQPIAIADSDGPDRCCVENLDLTGIVQGHWDYRDKLLELVQLVGLSSGVSLPLPPFHAIHNDDYAVSLAPPTRSKS